MVNNSAWTEKKEIEVLNHMVSNDPRGDFKSIINVDEKIKRLEGWLTSSELRVWPYGFNIQRCVDHAHRLLKKLEDGIL